MESAQFHTQRYCLVRIQFEGERDFFFMKSMHFNLVFDQLRDRAMKSCFSYWNNKTSHFNMVIVSDFG